MTDAENAEIVETLEHLAVVNVQPGDILVLRHPEELSAEQAVFLREHVEEIFPGHQCVVLSGGLELAVARPIAEGAGR